VLSHLTHTDSPGEGPGFVMNQIKAAKRPDISRDGRAQAGRRWKETNSFGWCWGLQYRLL